MSVKKRLSRKVSARYANNPRVRVGIRYAEEVAAGRIPAGKICRLACQRSLKDHERKRFKYSFDAEEAERVIAVIEYLPHTKGKWAAKRESIRLEPWQIWIFTELFGWIKNSTGKRRYREAYISVPRKNGKALCLDTMIPTPDGLRRLGDIKPGSEVIGGDGRPCRVVAETEVQLGRPCYELTFSTGERVIADSEHEWVTDAKTDRERLKGRGGKTAAPRPSIKTTSEIFESLKYGRADRVEWNHRVAVAPAVELPDRELTIDPYIFGLWLGDGTSSCAQITVGKQDARAIEDSVTGAGYPFRKLTAVNLYSLSDGIRHGKPELRAQTVCAKLRSLDVIQNKHIPESYLTAGTAQRIALLQGLMDSDGFCSKVGQCEFTTTSPALRDGFLQLAGSLGLKCSCLTHRATLDGRDCGEKYRIIFVAYSDFPVFRLARKWERQKTKPSSLTRTSHRQIVEVTPVDSVPVKCIQVDSDDHTFCIGASCIPTHNSLVAAAIGLLMLSFDGEVGAEVYCGATTQKQAWEVFKPARMMVMKTPELRDEFNIEPLAGSLVVVEDGSKFEPVIGDPGDGSSPSCAIIDEYHEHRTPDQYDTMASGMGARDAPLMLVITTAGVMSGGPCYQHQRDAERVVEGVASNDELFVAIWHADADDDWADPKTIEKANPNMGVSVGKDYLLSRQREAVASASRQNVFRTKHLNQWVGARSAFLNMRRWLQCRTNVSLSDLAGEECMIAIDLASKSDLACVMRLFPDDKAGRRHFYAYPRFYLPEAAVENDKTGKYQAWVKQGLITVTDGDEIDFGRIREDVEEDLSTYSVIEVAYDPWRATQLAQELGAAGATMVEYRNTVQQMSEPMKEIEAAVNSRRFHHDGNDVLAWMASNVVNKIDANNNYFPRKEQQDMKIDGIVAAIMGIGRLIYRDPAQQVNVYQERGLRTL